MKSSMSEMVGMFGEINRLYCTKETQGYLDKARQLLAAEQAETPKTEMGLRGALKTRIEFEIGLYSDHGVQAVILEQDGGGFRLSNSKATGSWNLVRKFSCSASVDEMFPEILSRQSTKEEKV